MALPFRKEKKNGSKIVLIFFCKSRSILSWLLKIACALCTSELAFYENFPLIRIFVHCSMGGYSYELCIPYYMCRNNVRGFLQNF